MKQFFKFMFASMLGVFLSLILMVILCFVLIAGIVSSASNEKQVTVAENSILHIDFKSPIKDRTSDNPFENLDLASFDPNIQPGLNDILKNLKKAESDPKIKGIYLDLSGLQAGMATMEEMRNGLIEFKKSKKFILAYSDFYSQGSYYLASVADEVWLNAEGVVDFRGFSAQIPFMKGLLEKLEIEPQVIRHGKFKSAIEPFILDKMSDANREQTGTYVNSFWNFFISKIGESRSVSVDSLQNIANNMLVQTSNDAMKYGLVDKIGYMDEFIGALNERTGKTESDEPELISLRKYKNAPATGASKEFTRDKIAVVYAAGNIVGGKGNSDEIGSKSLSETIRKARLDSKVKAVVLRVNSPGGDALASDIIWREMELCRKVKPVIVSMGDVAASGGYYISCAADTIVAQPNTITGSIGVFGLLFNAQKMLNNKLGITFDTYKTGPFADMGTPTRPLTDAERQILQNSVEQVYGTFTKRVADGRKMGVADVDSIGQGRVWSGVDAKRIGLVDVLGGLNDAVEIAAKKAGITNYRISELPEKKDPLQQILNELSGEATVQMMKMKIGENYQFIKPANELLKMQGVQARMMFGISNF